MKPLIWGLLVTAASLSLLFPVSSVWFLGDGNFQKEGQFSLLTANRSPWTVSVSLKVLGKQLLKS